MLAITARYGVAEDGARCLGVLAAAFCPAASAVLRGDEDGDGVTHGSVDGDLDALPFTLPSLSSSLPERSSTRVYPRISRAAADESPSSVSPLPPSAPSPFPAARSESVSRGGAAFFSRPQRAMMS